MNIHIPPFNHSRVINPSGNSSLRSSFNNNSVGVTSTWTVMGVWKYLNNSISVGTLVDIGATSGINKISFSVGSGNKYTCDIRDISNVVIKNLTWATFIGLPVLPNTWQHFVATMDGSTLNMYINGVLTTPSTITTDITGSQADPGNKTVAIGSTVLAGNKFVGQISQVALWNSVLTQAEVTSLYNNGGPWTFDLRAAVGDYQSYDNLTHWWCCGRNGTYQDLGKALSGFIDLTANSTLTETGDVTSECPNLNSYSRFNDYCLDTDGSTERLRSTTVRTIGIDNTWSALIWFKSNRNTAQETIFEIRSGATNTNRLRFQNRGDLAAERFEIDFYDSSSVSIRDNQYDNVLTFNQWVGVLATWDGTTLNVWSNGRKLNPSVIGTIGFGTMTNTTRTIGWGLGAQVDQFCSGRHYTAAVWSTVLSDAECVLLTQANPSTIRWLNLAVNGYGYLSAASLQQWFRGGLAPLTSIANSGYITNDGLGTTPLPNLVEGAANMTVADIVQDAPP